MLRRGVSGSPFPRREALPVLVPAWLRLGLLLATLGLHAACSAPTEPEAAEPRPVDFVELGNAARLPLRQFPGEVRADQRAELSFRVAGPLVQLPVQEGQIVRQGELLARIDPRDFANEAQLRQSYATEARTLFERVARALTNNAVTVAERDQVRARSEVAQAELTLAQNALADTELRAPFAGRIARRLVENFQNVQPGDGILILEDITRLEVRIQLPEQDVVRLPPDAPMHGTTVGTVSFPSLPGQSFPVTVKELTTRADPRTNTYRVVLSLPRPEDGNILPGMSASFQPAFDIVASEPVYRLPVEAIQAKPDSQAFVWILTADGQAVERRSIRKGRLSGASVEIREGLQAGDRVVIRGGAYLADGMRVQAKLVQDRN